VEVDVLCETETAATAVRWEPLFYACPRFDIHCPSRFAKRNIPRINILDELKDPRELANTPDSKTLSTVKDAIVDINLTRVSFSSDPTKLSVVKSQNRWC